MELGIIEHCTPGFGQTNLAWLLGPSHFLGSSLSLTHWFLKKGSCHPRPGRMVYVHPRSHRCLSSINLRVSPLTNQCIGEINHTSPFCGDITIVPSFWMVNSLHFNDRVARQNFWQRLLDAYVLSHDGHGPLERPVGSGVYGVISWGKTECDLAPLRIQGLLLNY